jgi:hypothetical protein
MPDDLFRPQIEAKLRRLQARGWRRAEFGGASYWRDPATFAVLSQAEAIAWLDRFEAAVARQEEKTDD